jgi:hypothetical protein
LIKFLKPSVFITKKNTPSIEGVLSSPFDS